MRIQKTVGPGVLCFCSIRWPSFIWNHCPPSFDIDPGELKAQQIWLSWLCNQVWLCRRVSVKLCFQFVQQQKKNTLSLTDRAALPVVLYYFFFNLAHSFGRQNSRSRSSSDCFLFCLFVFRNEIKVWSYSALPASRRLQKKKKLPSISCSRTSSCSSSVSGASETSQSTVVKYTYRNGKQPSFHGNKLHHVTVCLFLQVHFYFFWVFRLLFVRRKMHIVHFFVSLQHLDLTIKTFSFLPNNNRLVFYVVCVWRQMWRRSHGKATGTLFSCNSC